MPKDSKGAKNGLVSKSSDATSEKPSKEANKNLESKETLREKAALAAAVKVVNSLRRNQAVLCEGVLFLHSIICTHNRLGKTSRTYK
jgi:hypothetical protein